MRILFLTHRLPFAPNRGDRIRSYHILQHLAARGNAVDLVSLVHDDEEASHARELQGLAQSVTIARVRRLRSLARAATALLTPRPLTHALLDAAELSVGLERVVAHARPDVVLAYCSGMARLALEPPLRGIPFVLDMVDVDSEKWAALGREGRGPKAWIYRREATLLGAFEQRAAAAAVTTLVVNERERNLLRSMGVTAPIEVVPNGVELSGLAPVPPANEPRVVFCGVMNYPPNETAALWLARDVWPAVRRARPEAILTILGANPTRRLRDLARNDRSIEVTGTVPSVQPYLGRSAVSVAPLLVARGLQNKVLEATAAGLPSVVTSAVVEGLPAEVAPACAVADSADAFAREILGLLTLLPAERRAIAQRAALGNLAWHHRLTTLEHILEGAARQETRRIA
jgi:sugar transferase (PEP-CTERM/EpsH1 system associated)